MQNVHAWKTKDQQMNDILESDNDESNSTQHIQPLKTASRSLSLRHRGLTTRLSESKRFNDCFCNIIQENKSYARIDYMTWHRTLCPTLFDTRLTTCGTHSSKWQENTTQHSTYVVWSGVNMLEVMYQNLLGKTEENSDSIVLITTWQGNMERAQMTRRRTSMINVVGKLSAAQASSDFNGTAPMGLLLFHCAWITSLKLHLFACSDNASIKLYC